jgi:LmbE family N-acetylglucosaminyl deacetylase
MAPHIFISPHLDDAVLSCGATIFSLTELGCEVIVVTVFSGSPSAKTLSPLAQSIHQSFGLGDDAVKVRRSEDHVAIRSLGAYLIHIGLPECIYRNDEYNRPLYVNAGDIYRGQLCKDIKTQAEILHRLSDIFASYAPTHVYAPVGIGNHVDHLLTRIVVENLLSDKIDYHRIKLLMYEDIPYACRSSQLVWKSNVTVGLQQVTQHVTQQAWESKLQAISKYQSQVRMLWGDETEMALELGSYAITPEENFSELFWRIVSTERTHNLISK